MKATAWVLVLASLGLAVQLPIRVSAGAWQAHVPKVAAQSLSAYLVVAGLAGSALAVTLFLRGGASRMPIAAMLGLVGALLAASYIQHATSPNDALAAAFGHGWQASIPVDQRDQMLQRRWRWALPGGAEPRRQPDVPYAKPSDANRELLADVWQPPIGVEPSGLGLVYVHGGYYEMLDKDSGTRPLFRHLTNQGHVVVDISYRLLDETDIFGMVGDVKRAIAWLKNHGAAYGVDADRIVVAGASSGANLALLAGYTSDHPRMTPEDVVTDTSVRAVVAYYGVHDWSAFSSLPGSDDGLIARLVGGTERHELASPISHVGPDTPATLLVQGLHDVEHLIDANRALAQALARAGVPVANVELPRTDHAFDLMPPVVGPHSPPGIAALHDLERFLALVNEGELIAHGP